MRLQVELQILKMTETLARRIEVKFLTWPKSSASGVDNPGEDPGSLSLLKRVEVFHPNQGSNQLKKGKTKTRGLHLT